MDYDTIGNTDSNCIEVSRRGIDMDFMLARLSFSKVPYIPFRTTHLFTNKRANMRNLHSRLTPVIVFVNAIQVRTCFALKSWVNEYLFPLFCKNVTES